MGFAHNGLRLKVRAPFPTTPEKGKCTETPIGGRPARRVERRKSLKVKFPSEFYKRRLMSADRRLVARVRPFRCAVTIVLCVRSICC